MPPGPAVISDSHQSVVQSAAAAASSVCDVAVLGGENAANSTLNCLLLQCHCFVLFFSPVREGTVGGIAMSACPFTAIKPLGLNSQVVEADNNSIENLEGVYHLPKLEEVSLKNNSILKPAD